MLIDLHVHTSRYSKCGRMSPEEMAGQALDVGLDGVVITEHNVMWSEEELAELRQAFPGLTILRGVEISCADKHDVLIYGIADLTPFRPRMAVAEAVAAAHAGGGIAILAHPLRYHQQLGPEVVTAPFDAVETKSVNIDDLHHQACSAIASRLGSPQVFSSDGHDTIALGTYASSFHVPVRNEHDLVAALRQRAFEPREWPERSLPALADRYSRQEQRIRRYIAEGISKPEVIWAKVGGALARVRRIVESA